MPRRSRRWRAVLAGSLVGGVAAGAGWLFGERTIRPESFDGGPIKASTSQRGEVAWRRDFAADSPEARAVTRWLAAHRRGWALSITSYAPGRVLRGERFDLNFSVRSAILNYRAGDSPNGTQVVRAIVPDDVPDGFGPPRGR